MFGGDSRTGFLYELFECAISQISKYDTRSQFWIGGELLFNLRIHRPRDHKQVGPTVVVEVHNARAPAGVVGFYANLGRQRGVIKISLSIIAVQTVGIVRKMCLEQVERAVEVVVSHADPHAGLLHTVIAKGDSAQNA